jgi:hypothetical protein
MQHRLNSVARSRHGIAILERLDQLVQNGPSLEFNYFHSLSAAENPGQPTAWFSDAKIDTCGPLLIPVLSQTVHSLSS